MALRALIFDFDGLIVDTETPSLEMAREAYLRHGIELPEALWQRCVGTHLDPLDHLQQLVGSEVDLTAMRSELDARHRAAVARQGPRAGVVELLDSAVAAGVRLGVASSSSHRWVEGHLQRIGTLELFRAVCDQRMGAVHAREEGPLGTDHNSPGPAPSC